MTVRNPEDAFLYELSLAHAGERTALQILEESAREVVDERARAVLTQHAEQTGAQIRSLEQVFTLLGTQPQAMSCPAMSAVRQELGLFREHAPAPQFLTTMTLFANLKIEHNEIATYGPLIDKAVLLGQLEAARILTTLAEQQQDTAAKIARLIHELLLEMVSDSGPATDVAAAGGGAAGGGAAGGGAGPHATAPARS
jgi:ferritin-like metal-binding protein YciE